MTNKSSKTTAAAQTGAAAEQPTAPLEDAEFKYIKRRRKPGRPPSVASATEKRKKLSAYFGETLVSKLEKEAKRDGVTPTEKLRRIVTAHFAES